MTDKCNKLRRVPDSHMVWWLPVFFLLVTILAVKAGDFTCTTNSDNTLTITDYSGPGGTLVIPAVIDSRTVTIIGYHVFGGGLLNPNTNLTSVTIPDSVTHIGISAFYSCAVLTNMTLGTGVTSIGNSAFDGCRSLADINLPDSLTSIGNNAFSGCRSLAVINFPDSLTSIGVAAFSSCNLTSVIIPNGVIGGGVFFQCRSLTNVTIGAGVTSIGENAFEDCSSLTAISVDAGNSVYSSLDGVLFNKNQTMLIAFPAGKAGSYMIPDGVTSIRHSAFIYCSKLNSITIPDSVTSIGEYAFQYCLKLTRVMIGNGVTSIGDYALMSCDSLINVMIGNSVTSIGRGAFSYSPNLMRVYFTGNAPNIGLDVFDGDNIATIYYFPGTTGWGLTFGGRPAMQWWDGPQISANGIRGNVDINRGDTLKIAVRTLNIGPYLGVPVDWWILVRAGSAWYYLNSSRQWTQFDGNLSNCHPVYQGSLFDLPAIEVLNVHALQPGSYTFWFGVDYPMDGILNIGGYILLDSVNVTIQ